MLITMKQSREKLNRMRIARGFFKGKIDGTIEESGEGQPSSSSASKGGGSGKGGVQR
jgi:hypothetical protein